MMRANWIPQARIFRPPNIASSGVYDVELNALGPGINAGFVAAEVGGLIVEFRMDDGFDAGLAGVLEPQHVARLVGEEREVLVFGPAEHATAGTAAARIAERGVEDGCYAGTL